jgi:hypothetical protein
MSGIKQHKRFCMLYACTVLVLYGVLILYGFIFDPWQLFHQAWFREPVFINNARFQDAGIINSYKFDSAIIGNSMAENFSAQEASEQLGGTFVNLSLAGSMFSEREIILKHLFRKKKIKNLIITLDHLPYVGVGQFNESMPPEQFDFLYNGNQLDDFRLYFDVKLFRCWNLKESCVKEVPGLRRESLEELYPWYPFYVKAFGGIQSWCDWSRRSAPFKAFLQEIVNVARAIEKGKHLTWEKKLQEKYQQNGWSTFDAYILPFVKAHPETRFYLFVPPYSRLWYAMQEQYYTSYYEVYLSFIEHIVQVTAGYPNVQLFAFGNMDFNADIANYKDQSHYHKDVNSKILHLMTGSTQLLTTDNIDRYLDEVKTLAHNYDLTAIADELDQCLNR